MGSAPRERVLIAAQDPDRTSRTRSPSAPSPTVGIRYDGLYTVTERLLS